MGTLKTPSQEFQSWVSNNVVEGTDGTGHPAYFVPYPALQKYWSEPDQINYVWESVSDPNRVVGLENGDILKNYLRIFSILVYISGKDTSFVGYLEDFKRQNRRDHSLPLTPEDCPIGLPSADKGSIMSPSAIEAREAFFQHQYLFSHVMLPIYNESLPLKAILPFKLEETLSRAGSGVSVVKKCSLDLRGLDTSRVPASSQWPKAEIANTRLQAHIVVKEYPAHELKHGFDHEVSAYRALGNYWKLEEASEYFLGYYGSFTQAGRGYLVLEYADQGSLQDFFAKNNTPYDQNELRGFWQALSNLFPGLSLLHGTDPDKPTAIRIIHQDLKPSNIFVFRVGSIPDYGYQFKIGDLGLSSARLVRQSSKDLPDRDNYSTRMYAAPELTNTQQDLAGINLGTTWQADIWSFGCILFEAAVWTVCHDRGLDEFLAKRQEDTKDKHQLNQAGYSGAFHDGKQRLESVDGMLATILQRTRTLDKYTKVLAKIVLEDMLVANPNKRKSAVSILTRFRDILHDADPCLPWESSKSLGDVHVPWKLPPGQNQGSAGYFQSLPARGRTGSAPAEINGDGRHIVSGSSSTPILSERTRHKPGESGEESPLPSVTGPQPDGKKVCTAEGEQMLPEDASSRHSTPAIATADKTLPPRNATQNSQSTRTSIQSASQCASYPKISVGEALSWGKSQGSKKGNVEVLDGEIRAVKQMRDKKLIVILDDSRTMRQLHWPDVHVTFAGFVSIFRMVHFSGISLYRTSKYGKSQNGNNEKYKELAHNVLTCVDGKMPPEIDMTLSLKKILNKVKSEASSRYTTKSSKLVGALRGRPSATSGIQISVWTDGTWLAGREPGDVSPLLDPLQSFLQEMQGKYRSIPHVSVRIIWFRSDVSQAILAHEGGLVGQAGMDVTYCTFQRDDFWPMFVGNGS